jgi:hypothetical protein
MLLLHEMIEKLRLRTWSVDCVEMKLGRPGAAGPTEYTGPGYLRQEADGSIAYRLYPPPPATFDPRSIFPAGGIAGQIIGHEQYYHLEALDKTGIVWQVERTLPTPDTCLLGSRHFKLVSGVAHEMAFTRPFVNLGVPSLTMVFFTEEKVPGNASTELTIMSPGGKTQKSSKHDTAKFSTAFGDFLVYNRPGMLVVEVTSRTAFPLYFEMRIVEALGFVLAKPLAWNVIERYENASETVRVRGEPVVVDATLPPPVISGTIDLSGGDVWRLFDKYLTFISAYAGDGFHPCSRHLFAVIEASAGAISARGLALGVATEGIAKELFRRAGAPMEGMAAVVEPLKKHCLAWPGMPAGDLGDSLKRRLPGMIGQLTNVSAKDKLHALAKNKTIYEAHIIAWNDLRNTLAHGVTPGAKSIQKLLDLCDSVTVLMYHLIFRAVGYEGRYRDYSVHRWPNKYYRGRPVTEEEKAVAAYYLAEKNLYQDDVARWYAGKNDLEQGLY